MGYSFCNCRCIFYTRPENITDQFIYAPVNGILTAPDPFFCEWGNNPYTFPHWNVRRFQILWQMDEMVKELEAQGYDVIRAWKDFDVQSKTPMCYHIEVKI